MNCAVLRDDLRVIEEDSLQKLLRLEHIYQGCFVFFCNKMYVFIELDVKARQKCVAFIVYCNDFFRFVVSC